jgi:putative aldouronate transport system permease protein
MIGIVVAFKKFNIYDGVLGSPWSGFDNFKFFFTTTTIWHVLFNTVFLNVLFITSTNIASVSIAIFLNEIRLKTVKRILQSSLLLPYFMSWVVISLMLQQLMNGINTQPALFNQLLTSLHVPGALDLAWYQLPQFWPAILTVVHLWQGAGYLSVQWRVGSILSGCDAGFATH